MLENFCMKEMDTKKLKRKGKIKKSPWNNNPTFHKGCVIKYLEDIEMVKCMNCWFVKNIVCHVSPVSLSVTITG